MPNIDVTIDSNAFTENIEDLEIRETALSTLEI